MKIFALMMLFAVPLLFSGQATAAAPAKVCSQDYKPVCGALDGKRQTYSNRCTAENAGATVLHEGKCIGGDVCTQDYKPVCAIDPATKKEKTYSNACNAEIANAVFVHDGECK